MNVELLAYTSEPEKVIAAAAKLCYAKDVTIDSLLDGLTEDKVNPFIDKLVESHHESPFEHAVYTFGVEGVSRSLLAQITRHRIGASFSVRSQRYCSEDNFDYVIPETIANHKEYSIKYNTLMTDIKKIYNELVEIGVPKEDARMVLPNACVTRFILTMNVRELWHFFSLRCCTRAQWEIRELAYKMLALCKSVSPKLFEQAGPNCVRGFCLEGPKSCGKLKK